MKKKIIIVLFVVSCLLSTVFIPRVIYGTFGTISGKVYENFHTESKSISFEEANKIDPQWAFSNQKIYSKYVKYKDTWYSKGFWLRKKVEIIEEGLSSEDPK